MKNALRRGDATALNVYTVAFTRSPGLFGYATFPWDYSSRPKLDGVVINYTTLPGGTFAGFNKGATLTHEAGHWVGLYHTFEGESCDGPGDYVDDTPTEAFPARECVPRNSCPRKPGTDRKCLPLSHLQPLLLIRFFPQPFITTWTIPTTIARITSLLDKSNALGSKSGATVELTLPRECKSADPNFCSIKLWRRDTDLMSISNDV